MQKMIEWFRTLKTFRWSLWFTLCLYSLVPAIYQTIRTALVSSNLSTSGIDIISQMEWFDLINETLLAFLVIPIYSTLNKCFKRKKEVFAEACFLLGFLSFAIYLIFSIVIYAYGEHLVSLMNQKEVDTQKIAVYLRLETIAFVIGILPYFFNTVFVVIGKKSNIYIFTLVQVVFSTFADFFLIPQIGVNGIAISNIITNAILASSGFLLLYFQRNIKPTWFNGKCKSLVTTWLKVGLFSAFQQFIDNIVYALMVVRMVNLVLEQGNYWIANNFIWSWLLIPISALSEVIKSDSKEDKIKRSNYYLILVFVSLIWFGSIPIWPVFLKYGERLDNYEEIYLILLKLVPFYLAYSLSTIPDSIFIGKGETYYNFATSLLVNGLYYGLWFIFYKAGIVNFTMDYIILMFGCGMIFHLLISQIEKLFDRKIESLKEYQWLRKNKELV